MEPGIAHSGWRLLTWLAAALLFSAVKSVAPYWPTLLPLLPLVGIGVVFALDRVAALWEETSQPTEREPAAEAGDASATVSLAVGLFIAAAAVTAVGYYQFAADGGDPPSYTGRALATLADAVAVLVASTPEQAVRLDDPVVQYAAGPARQPGVGGAGQHAARRLARRQRAARAGGGCGGAGGSARCLSAGGDRGGARSGGESAVVCLAAAIAGSHLPGPNAHVQTPCGDRPPVGALADPHK